MPRKNTGYYKKKSASAGKSPVGNFKKKSGELQNESAETPVCTSSHVEPMDVDISDYDSQSLDTELEQSLSASGDAPASSSNFRSASKRKLDSYDINYNLMEDTAKDTGYILVSKSSIKSLLASFPCPTCEQNTLTLRENLSAVDGCNANFEILCLSEHCEADVVQKWCTSGTVGDRRFADVNLRLILAMRNAGVGFSGIQEFCRVMGMYCMCRSTYDRHKERLHTSAQRAADRSLRTAGESVRTEYMKKNTSLSENDTMEICVSYDATWQKSRGFNSKHGVGTVIDLETGLVLDTETMSKYCHQCVHADKKYLDKESQEFQDWFQSHAPNCDINHEGSSGAMEKMAAEAIWKRSVSKHGFRYTTVLSDGDTKTVDHLNKLSPYGEGVPISKEECINHVSKRMYANLKNFSTRCSARGKPIGGQGKGKITEKRMKQWGTYYRNAISENVGNVEIMQKRILAILHHSSSTEQKPRHDNCPEGTESWCFHQKAVAEGKVPEVQKNHDAIPIHVADELEKTVFAHLMSRDKLERCRRNGTQNQNESYNNHIWRIQPKQIFGGHRSIVFAVNIAQLSFNMGSTGMLHIMHEARMTVPNKSVRQSIVRDQVRVEKSQEALKESSKRNRKAKKMAAAKQKDNTDYRAGMF